jgi:hypothetical protein
MKVTAYLPSFFYPFGCWRSPSSLISIAVLSVAVEASVVGTPLKAEELNQIFEKVQGYVSAKNYPKALEELSWARKEIEKQHLEKLKEFFPSQVSRFDGQKFNSQGAFGMSQLERNYSGPEGALVKVSLVGSNLSGQALGGLSQFGKMAAMMGMQDGSQDSFRIDGYTAALEDNGQGRANLSVYLDSGSVLKLELVKKGEAGILRQFAEELNLQGLDAYIKGQG